MDHVADVTPAPALASVPVVDDPQLTDVLPENDPHLIKARLLANAAMNEYIRPEIQLSETSSEWGAFAEAEIYESFGESTRALQAMKRSKIPFFSSPSEGRADGLLADCFCRGPTGRRLRAMHEPMGSIPTWSPR